MSLWSKKEFPLLTVFTNKTLFVFTPVLNTVKYQGVAQDLLRPCYSLWKTNLSYPNGQIS